MENPEQHKVNLRKATYDDLEDICDIYTQVFKDHNGETFTWEWDKIKQKSIATKQLKDKITAWCELS